MMPSIIRIIHRDNATQAGQGPRRPAVQSDFAFVSENELGSLRQSMMQIQEVLSESAAS